jgi:hypothetical protein
MNRLLTLEPDLIEWPLADNNEIINWGFLIFLLCFFINVFLIGKRLPLVFSMIDSLFHKKERQSIFFIQGNSGLVENFLMLLQTALLSGLLFYCFQKQLNPDFSGSLKELFLYTGTGIAFFLSFFLYKYLTYNLIGFSFFTKEQNQLWNNHFVSILCLSGIFLFIPTLLFFFVSKCSVFCFYFIPGSIVLIYLLAIYTLYRIFFQNKVNLLYFILYLCAQEMAPLYLVYKGIVYFL